MDNRSTKLQRSNSEPIPPRPTLTKTSSIRHHITFSERRFDVTTLPADLLRVYRKLADEFGSDYALHIVFCMRTAVELHRAWHMTLLTTKILQQIKQRFKLRMTWDLGVTLLKFRMEDGGHELHRRVPYDYDSEFQDLYMKIASALIEGRITIHEALIFQAETKQGKHTAQSGLFLRNNPGRLVLYPAVAATCTIIFFNGDWNDAGVAACCGLGSGLMEYALGFGGNETKVLIDVLVGVTTGVIAGLFHRFHTSQDYCLSSIFLGTLYWFFYGTAFVIGILEILAGELQTGVTRFIAVSVKTFVLTLGSTIGLLIALENNPSQTWYGQEEACGTIDLDQQWWRIPLYLLCSVSVLGQYRFPVINYWQGLVVQLVGYEVQYQMFKYFAERHKQDFLDTAVSNICGAVASVVAASMLSYMLDELGSYYSSRLLQREMDQSQRFSAFGRFMYNIAATYVRLSNMIGLGRRSTLEFLQMENKLKEQARELKDPANPRQSIVLEPREETILVEAIVDAENVNLWSLLMPAVYQLVPGSLIAKLWYNAVFPPPLIRSELTIEGTPYKYYDVSANPLADDVFYGLMVISTSLALGLLLGFAVVEVFRQLSIPLFSLCNCCKTENQTKEEKEEEQNRIKRQRFRQQGVMNAVTDDDPDETVEGDPVLSRVGSEAKKPLGLERVERVRMMEDRVMDIVKEEEDDPREQPNERAASTPSLTKVSGLDQD